MVPLMRRAGGMAAFALAASLLAACGFRPMYGEPAREPTPISADLAAIEVDLIPERSGQLMRNALVRLLNPASEADAPRRYTLSVGLREWVATFAVERTGFATRANVEVVATYTLVED